MFRQLNFRDRLVAMAAVPILVVAVVAAGLLIFLDASGTRPYGIFALVGLGLSAALAFAIGRSILGSLDELTQSTTNLAEAHQRMADGEITVDDLPTVSAASKDELGQIANAINEINTATIAVGESQRGAVKEGLSNIVVNLARRSQTLLDRQVEYLDRLESSEEDPDRLGELFKVDHLATRMRRNAESLMVLAEADPGRRRGGPVEVADVLRVAMGEVENYQHIDLSDVDDGQVGATVAVDLAHLVAELMENATQFSPPDTPVDVSGTFDKSERFVVVVADHGMGMTEDKLTEANRILADPPELGLAMGRSLGFMVIGRLAKRLGADVTLGINGSAGLRAVVSIPADLINSANGSAKAAPSTEASDKTASDNDSDTTTSPAEASTKTAGRSDSDSDRAESASAESNADDAAPQASSAALERLLGIDTSNFGRAERSSEAPDDWASTSPFDTADESESEKAESWTPPEVTVGPPRALEEAVPSGDAFESGVASLLNDQDGDQNADQDGDQDDSGAGSRGLRDDDATSAGLTKRQRGASQVPIGQGRPVAASSRDPEEVRTMLSRYREGLKGNKTPPGEHPDEGQPTDNSNKTKDR